jgi:NAD(P)-dependent dehydrogenase (short-subunit alcohol dehydrogenase family)
VSKFGTEGLAEVLADELESTTIRVNLINPGATRTRMRGRAYPAENPASVQSPESATPAYVYLLGPDSRDVRGQRFNLQEAKAAV